MTRARVVVIGAGIAGLAAARRLREHGLEVRLLERADRAGGRATSDLRDGFRFDAGAHVVSARDSALLELARAGGAGPVPLRPLALAQVHGGAVRLLDPAGVPEAARPPGLGPASALRFARLERLLARFGPLFEAGAPERAARLDDRSAAELARLYLGERALRRWAAPTLAELGQEEPERASRALLMADAGLRGFAPRGTVRGGLGAVVDGLAEQAGCELGAEVRALEPVARGVAVQVAGPEGGWTLEADAAVVATRAGPAARLAAPLLSRAERALLGAVRYARASVLTVALERPVLREAVRVRVPAVEGLPLRAALFLPGPPDGAAPEGAGVALLVASEAFARRAAGAPDDAVRKELLAALERLVPGTAGAVRFALLRRHAEAHPRFDVGVHRALARLARIEADRRGRGGRLYLAGDYRGGPTLEGAARSGARAAEAAIADLGLPTPRGSRPAAG